MEKLLNKLINMITAVVVIVFGVIFKAIYYLTKSFLWVATYFILGLISYFILSKGMLLFEFFGISRPYASFPPIIITIVIFGFTAYLLSKSEKYFKREYNMPIMRFITIRFILPILWWTVGLVLLRLGYSTGYAFFGIEEVICATFAFVSSCLIFLCWGILKIAVFIKPKKISPTYHPQINVTNKRY